MWVTNKSTKYDAYENRTYVYTNGNINPFKAFPPKLK